MKKILCFIDELGSGGAERQLVGLAGLLKEKGYDVDVFCYHPKYFYERYLQKKNVKLLKVNRSPKNGFEKLLWSYRTIKKGRYDVIISFSPGSSFASLLTKPLFRHTKLLVSDRNLTPCISLKQRLRFHLYRLADYIVPNSFSQTEILSTHFPFMRRKLHTITNFIDTNEFSAVKLSNTTARIFNLIVVARPAIDKNIPRFIKAVRLLKNMRIPVSIKWYGFTDSELGHTYAQQAKDAGVEDVLSFLPPNPNIREVYSTADALCLPSVREGFSNVIGEALLCGLPIVCGNISDNVRLVEDDVNGYLFNPLDSENMANTIKKMIETDFTKRQDMHFNNIRKAKKILSSEIFINKYCKLIE